MKIIALSFFILALTSSFVFITEPVAIKFTPAFDNRVLEPGKNYFLPSANDSVSIETFRFYISNITFLKDRKIVYREADSYHLIDLEKPPSFKIEIKPESNFDFNTLQFNIGIDSLTNVSGAMGGDLDPVNGMYWTWQSGYINFKIEGTGNICNTRNHKFQFHIGGYQHPFATLQTVILPVKKETTNEIVVDIKKLLEQVDLKTMNEVMSPGEKAVKIATIYKTIFTVKQ